MTFNSRFGETKPIELKMNASKNKKKKQGERNRGKKLKPYDPKFSSSLIVIVKEQLGRA